MAVDVFERKGERQTLALLLAVRREPEGGVKGGESRLWNEAGGIELDMRGTMAKDTRLVVVSMHDCKAPR